MDWRGIRARLDGDHNHVGFPGGVGGLFVQHRVREVVEFPPRTMEFVIVLKLFGQMLA
jgi:hypothetical protein